jgi:hypothetical protein
MNRHPVLCKDCRWHRFYSDEHVGRHYCARPSCYPNLVIGGSLATEGGYCSDERGNAWIRPDRYNDLPARTRRCGPDGFFWEPIVPKHPSIVCPHCHCTILDPDNV